MRATTLFLALFILTTSGKGLAQFQDLNAEQIDDHESITILRLTPEMFSDQILIPDLTVDTESTFRFLDTDLSHWLIHLSANVIWNKLDTDSGVSFFSSYPGTVTEFNNAVRRQMFDAEPTSQQRRSTIFFRNN